jgi:hypothetical protein
MSARRHMRALSGSQLQDQVMRASSRSFGRLPIWAPNAERWCNAARKRSRKARPRAELGKFEAGAADENGGERRRPFRGIFSLLSTAWLGVVHPRPGSHYGRQLQHWAGSRLLSCSLGFLLTVVGIRSSTWPWRILAGIEHRRVIPVPRVNIIETIRYWSRLGLGLSFRVGCGWLATDEGESVRWPRYCGGGASRKYCQTVHLFAQGNQLCSSMTYEGVSLESLHGWERFAGCSLSHPLIF